MERAPRRRRGLCWFFSWFFVVQKTRHREFQMERQGDQEVFLGRSVGDGTENQRFPVDRRPD